MKNKMLTLLAVLVAGTLAQAAPFYKPPEIYAPGWVTQFPYQRNISLDFNVSPVAPAGPGIPGADYEGYLDPELKHSDVVTLSGAVQWYNNLTGITPTGLIGIDNRLGTETLTGSIIIRIDNTLWENPEKHLWLEQDAFITPGNSGFGEGVWGPNSPYQWPVLGGLSYRSLGNGFSRNEVEWGTTPNPPWEELHINFIATAGSAVLFDTIHIATECVPEPGTASLALLGLCALAVRQLRRK